MRSLSMPAIYKPSNTLVMAVFHDRCWRGSSMSSLLQNTDIFIGIPLDDANFLMGNIVPSYVFNEHEIDMCFMDIEWLWPRNVHELFLCNWNLKNVISKARPIVENWYKCVDRVQKMMKDRLKQVTAKLSKTETKLRVCLV